MRIAYDLLMTALDNLITRCQLAHRAIAAELRQAAAGLTAPVRFI